GEQLAEEEQPFHDSLVLGELFYRWLVNREQMGVFPSVEITTAAAPFFGGAGQIGQQPLLQAANDVRRWNRAVHGRSLVHGPVGNKARFAEGQPLWRRMNAVERE